MTTIHDPHTLDARQHLQRAYLLMGWGDLDAALDACDRAAAVDPDNPHPLPDTLRGAILIAGGQLDRALAELRDVTRRWSDFCLAHLHFAEACFLAGRTRHAARALESARACDDFDRHARLADHLTELQAAIPDDYSPIRIDID